MGQARRHHLVPAFYLRRFADEAGRIRRIDMSGGNRVMSVSNAAVETDFYTIQTGDGPSDEIEKRLSEIETRAADALRAVDAGQLVATSETMTGLAEFAAIQATRGRDFRDTMNDFTNQIAQMMFAMIGGDPKFLERAVTDILGREPTDEELQRYREDLARRDEFKVAMSDNAAVQAMLEGAASVVPILSVMPWHLLGVPDDSPVLVTSDRPVALWARERPGQFYAVGFGTADEITLPIDPRSCFVITPPGERPSEETTIENVIRRTVGAAHRWVFSHPDVLAGP
jgi:hypothetical protein